MTDQMIVQHCSPTLAGMKTGSMFPCSYTSRGELFDYIRRLNKRLVPRGLRVVPLRYTETKALVYVFRPSNLKRDLSHEMAISLLKEHGYRDTGMESSLSQLIERFRQGGEFPHEVGFFLGYPPEDVCGFIRNKACSHKCVGCWKVYGDESEARKTFDKYRKCTQVYCSHWERGKPIEQLAVAG